MLHAIFDVLLVDLSRSDPVKLASFEQVLVLHFGSRHVYHAVHLRLIQFPVRHSDKRDLLLCWFEQWMEHFERILRCDFGQSDLVEYDGNQLLNARCVCCVRLCIRLISDFSCFPESFFDVRRCRADRAPHIDRVDDWCGVEE